MNPNEVDLAAAIRALDRANAHIGLEIAKIDAQIDETLRFTEDILAKYPGYDAARQAEGQQ